MKRLKVQVLLPAQTKCRYFGGIFHLTNLRNMLLFKLEYLLTKVFHMKYFYSTHLYYSKFAHRLKLNDSNLYSDWPGYRAITKKFDAMISDIEEKYKIIRGIDFTTKNPSSIFLKDEKYVHLLLDVYGTDKFSEYSGPLKKIDADNINLEHKNYLWKNIYPFKVRLIIPYTKKYYDREEEIAYIQKVKNWASFSVSGYYEISHSSIYFTNHADAIAFKMSFDCQKIESINQEAAILSLKKINEICQKAINELEGMIED